MNGWQPVETMADLETLDHDEVVEGYKDGCAKDPGPEPGNNRSRSYWHGWRNGMMDRGHMPIDESARILAHNYLKAQRNDRR